MSPLIPDANAIECYDCNQFYEDADECPEDPSIHGYIPVYITDIPLGFPDDEDYFHHGIKRYVYNVEE